MRPNPWDPLWLAGIDINPAAAEAARGRGDFDVRTGRLEELPWESATFDLITCLDVIEHTPDDRVILAELRRMSKPGGWLLLTVPAYQVEDVPSSVELRCRPGEHQAALT